MRWETHKTKQNKKIKMKQKHKMKTKIKMKTEESKIVAINSCGGILLSIIFATIFSMFYDNSFYFNVFTVTIGALTAAFQALATTWYTLKINKKILQNNESFYHRSRHYSEHLAQLICCNGYWDIHAESSETLQKEAYNVQSLGKKKTKYKNLCFVWFVYVCVCVCVCMCVCLCMVCTLGIVVYMECSHVGVGFSSHSVWFHVNGCYLSTRN